MTDAQWESSKQISAENYEFREFRKKCVTQLCERHTSIVCVF